MASGARHDALLDLRRSAPSDLPQRWEGGRAGASCDPSAAATRLKAVVELYGVFKEIAGEALGGRKCHSHFEQWLWACRVDLIVSGAICAPVLTAVPPAAAQAELARKLERAGVEPAKARDSCARLAAACARDEWLADTREKGVVTLETVPPARARRRARERRARGAQPHTPHTAHRGAVPGTLRACVPFAHARAQKIATVETG